MHPIIDSLLSGFCKQFEITRLPEDERFEHFVTYSILTPRQIRQGTYTDALTGKGEEGIDAIAIILNGILITEPEQIEDIANRENELRAEYVFIQAKRAEKFDGGDTLKFTRAVREFFSEGTDIGTCERVATCRDIHSKLLSYAANFAENPSISAYFVTTGRNDPQEMKDHNSTKYMKELKRDLSRLQLFSSIKPRLYGTNELAESYRSATTAVEVTIDFSERVTLPSIDGIQQAYLGLLPLSQLLKLIIDENQGSLRSYIFDDNVRDYQGDDTVANSGMKETLTSKHRKQFTVMNNGITIVARDLTVIGNQLTLRDFQIVNGAQTSNVIFNNRASLSGEDILIPTKLIQSNDEELITRVVLATNSQTEVTTTQLNARAKAERNIEKFFAAKNPPRNLLYERRKGQYDRDTSIVKARVIDRTALVRATASTFGNEAHTATGYQQQLLKRLRETKDSEKRRYLGDDDEPILYYAAASAYYKLDLLLKTSKLEAYLKPARWHLLNIARKIAVAGEFDDPTDRKIRKRLSPFLDTIWDDHKCEALFKEAIEVLESTNLQLEREVLRSTASANLIEQAIQSYLEQREKEK